MSTPCSTAPPLVACASEEYLPHPLFWCCATTAYHTNTTHRIIMSDSDEEDLTKALEELQAQVAAVRLEREAEAVQMRLWDEETRLREQERLEVEALGKAKEAAEKEKMAAKVQEGVRVTFHLVMRYTLTWFLTAEREVCCEQGKESRPRGGSAIKSYCCSSRRSVRMRRRGRLIMRVLWLT
jgi:hypothetical protein